MGVLDLQLYALIGDVHTAAQAEGQGILQLDELASPPRGTAGSSSSRH